MPSKTGLHVWLAKSVAPPHVARIKGAVDGLIPTLQYFLCVFPILITPSYSSVLFALPIPNSFTLHCLFSSFKLFRLINF